MDAKKKEREEFEAQVRKDKSFHWRWLDRLDGDPDYCSGDIQRLWEFWQAALRTHENESEAGAISLPEGLHQATADLVVSFASAMAEKLAAAEKKYGYCDGWKNSDWMDECRAKLIEHMGKGDPRDVANYCAFLWFHGEQTAPPSAKAIETAAYMRAAAWLHPITGAVIKASDRIDGVTLTDFNIPLYLAPTTHPAIEAAAILHAADVCDRISLEYQWAAEEGKLKNVKWNRNMWKSRTAAEIAKQIRTIIPQDGRTSLEEFGMKVARQTLNTEINEAREFNPQLRAIVRSVPPLNSESVRGEK